MGEGTIRLFRPKWLRRASKRLLWYSDDLVLAERTTIHGRKTFALGIDHGGRAFPQWIITDMPMRDIKELIKDALLAARITGKDARTMDFLKLARIGEEIRESNSWTEYVTKTGEGKHPVSFI